MKTDGRRGRGRAVDTNLKNHWTIKSWSREQGRGVVTCPQIGDLPFDGSAAMVSDFRLGERVEVKLEGPAGSLHVSTVWPDNPRFAPRDVLPQSTPALAPDIASRAANALATIPTSFDFRVISLDGDLLIRGDDDAFAYGHLVEVRFRAVEYVELPMGWDGKSFSLANEIERAYLSCRTEISSSTIAVRIVDAARQIFFVACADVETTTNEG
jgi:hypothetical protein